ncbi:MAG TPA: ethanolamine ammonia-lyase subunit EutC [Polyangiaceae bacterium]|nr:ethanolamine ammonia-lyase subunit EutC [Polyangiaceae bacterium]
MSELRKRDAWASLARHTAARIALGRAGGSLPTQAVLDFRLAHALARDAVEMPFDADALLRELESAGVSGVKLGTRATNRRDFLLQPELGRQLDEDSRTRLRELFQGSGAGAHDLCVVVSDGLSALAAERQVLPLLRELWPQLSQLGVSLYPCFVVPFARVKLADELGQLLQAKHSLILLGERPGLSSPDSLGAYLTFEPAPSRTDADRNCVSNIRPAGLPVTQAAHTLLQLLRESRRLSVSGVALKVDSGPMILARPESQQA